MPILWLWGKFDGFHMYHPLSLNGYSKIINAVKRQRNLGLTFCMIMFLNMMQWQLSSNHVNHIFKKSFRLKKEKLFRSIYMGKEHEFSSDWQQDYTPALSRATVAFFFTWYLFIYFWFFINIFVLKATYVKIGNNETIYLISFFH